MLVRFDYESSTCSKMTPQGDFSGQDQHTNVIPLNAGQTYTWEAIVKAFASVGLPSPAEWEAGNDEGEYTFSFIGDNEGYPCEDGEWGYWGCFSLSRCTVETFTLPK